ncbi:hypothetical protein BD779DRAFT_1467302 [Infundibulicybe gibba]|nr:hypothetical protein BD779DRAFT_1467302 [Infundibulicybe gibba]
MSSLRKRKLSDAEDDHGEPHKQRKLASASDSTCEAGAATSSVEISTPSVPATVQVETTNPDVPKKRDSQGHRIRKLAPPRPYPTVPTSVSATGPQSAHKEGKNYICITRKTSVGAYMRRCKNVILQDGYKTLYLSAMGAAIPHLLYLSSALPSTLPFAPDEIHVNITTGTLNVQDEVIPLDEDEEITYQTRGKSTLNLVIKIGDGEFDGDSTGPLKKHRKVARPKKAGTGVKAGASVPQKVFQEPEQEPVDMI